MSASKNILVFGGTGVIGQYITQALLDSKSSFGRIAIFTSANTVSSKASQLSKWKEQGLEVITGDLTKDDQVAEAYKSFDTVVSALGRNTIAEQISLIKLAEDSGTIKKFLPSEYGTDIEYFPQSATEKPHQLKLKVRAYIKNEVKKLEYTYVVTGPYADLYIGKTPSANMGTFDADAKKASLLGDGNGRVSLTTMEDTGKLVVAALKHPHAARNRALKVNSFTTTPNEVLAEYERQTGGQKWDVSYVALPALKKYEEEAWARGDPKATGYTLRRIWTEGGTLYEKRDNGLIELENTDTLEGIVHKLLQK